MNAIIDTLFGSWLNTIVTLIISYISYQFIKSKFSSKKDEDEEDKYTIPPPLPKHDMTLEELRRYDGKHEAEQNRICVAILGKVYDCSKGYRFYGPSGPYNKFSGHDATRALAEFDVALVKDEWDDTSDMSEEQLSSVRDWAEQFNERYELVGNLVRDTPEAETLEPSKSDGNDD